MKTHVNYYKAAWVNSANSIKLQTMEELCTYIDNHKIETVFVGSINEESFIVAHNNLIIYHRTCNYITIEDYVNAKNKGFATATDYYEAKQMGYHSFVDYDLVKQAGIADHSTFEMVKKLGFISGFEKFKEIVFANPSLIANEKETINNPYQLYLLSKKLLFDDCTMLLEAFSRGFANAGIFNTANELKFPTYADFTEATEKKLANFDDLTKARELGIKNFEEFEKYYTLQSIKKENESIDELVLLIILSKLEQGKKISVKKISIALENAIKEYEYEDSHQLPVWFKRTLNTDESISHFLEKNNAVKTYGSYDSEGEYFEIHKLQNRSVVLDASNIAHNSNNPTDKKVYAHRIIKVIKFLESKGFKDICIVADASIRHKIEDKEVFDKLKKEYNYVQSPVNTSADEYMLTIVRVRHCLVVSNDGFRQWKLKDKWVAENIDFYRLGFMINNEEVIMPDVK